MDTRLEVKLIECLSALDQGESIDQVLARYPDDAAKLRPYLVTAKGLPALRMQPSEASKMKSREAFLNQAAALRHSKRRAVGFLPRFASSLAAVVLVVGLVGGGAVVASGSALPGDPLYGLKRTVENVRLALSADSSTQAAMAAQFNQTRVDEIKSLINASRSAGVEFSGPIQLIQANDWTVDTVTVLIDSATQITGSPSIGVRAHVVGTTGSSGVTASSITVEANNAPQPTPTPTPSPTPFVPSPRIENTPTPVPGVTPTPTITFTRMLTPTVAPAATPQPTETEFSGAVQSIGADSWTINGVVVQVTGSTQIEAGIAIGENVDVKALKFVDGRLVAQQISRTGQSGSPTGNTNTNDNSNSNSDKNSNGNENSNNNENSNSNENVNDNSGNSNMNENSNENNNDNSNDNSNSNDNTNSNDS